MDLPVITIALWPEEKHQTFGTGYFVYPVGDPRVAGIAEGQRVILREDPEFELEAIMHRVMAPAGMEWWFGAEIPGTFRYLEEPVDETDTLANQIEH